MKQIGISRDKKKRLDKKTVKQMGISRYKERRLNKETVKQVGMSIDKKKIEQEDSESYENK